MRHGCRLDHPDGHRVVPPPRSQYHPSTGGPLDSHTSGLDADTIVALHAQAAEVHHIRSLVSIVLDPASSHYPRWRA
jgi:hypothetical protein